MYTKAIFDWELRKHLLQKQAVKEIGVWAYSTYLNHIEEIDDPNFDDLLLTLNTIKLGPEFAFYL